MSHRALALIDENKRTRSYNLNLLDSDITEIPPAVSELTWLQAISFSNTKIIDLSPIANLSSLKNLNLSNTPIVDISPVAGLPSLQYLDVSFTQVEEISPVENLSSLRILRASNTHIKNLSPIANLFSLQQLDVSFTQIKDISPAENLSSLQVLFARNTQIENIPQIANLSSLRHLNLSNTQIKDLSPIANLTGLETLLVMNTLVNDLTPVLNRIRRGWWVQQDLGTFNRPGIYLQGCPMTNPPVEIAAQGNEAILNYFAERGRGQVDNLYEAKMLILGEGGSGKTSLVRRLYQPWKELPAEADTTRGIEIHKHEFKLPNGRSFRLNVWDFGGQQIYHATHQFFLTQRSLYILLDDTRKDHKSPSDEGFRSWLDLIDIFGGHSPTLIFQNEKGGRSKAIDFDGIRRRYANVEKLYHADLENPRSTDKLREEINFHASHLSHIGEELPAAWIEIRGEIERLAAKHPYISIDKYLSICSPRLQSDETRAMYLSRYLHDLGVFLHFQDDALLRRTVILQNEWATTAVFRVIDDEIVKKKRGRFNFEDCQRLWSGTGYGQMHPELLALMQNFELCYEQSDCAPRTWLVPQLLPPAKPAQLADWAQPGDLALRYRYEFLPKGMISRLTVRKHRFVRNPELAWVTGVLFAQERTEVLAEILSAGNEIELRARGPESKALLSVIAADLDALNDTFQGLRDKVDKRIPCNCKPCTAAVTPEFYFYKDLVRRKEHGRLQIECPRSYENVSVLELLDGIKVESPPAWAKESSKRGETRTMRIFLASSAELREDRDAFEFDCRRLNDQLRKEGLYLEIVRWENFFEAMSATRLQDEYNKAVTSCDVFVSLFFTKAGKYSQEEFKTAFSQFTAAQKPLVYVYFKDASVSVRSIRSEDLQSLRDFESTVNALGHFPSDYKDATELKLKFRDQLPRIRERLKI
jgi:GTPase SAR1 family protein